MSAVEEELGEDQNGASEDEDIPHTQYKVTSEITAFTKGEVVNGSTEISLHEGEGIAAVAPCNDSPAPLPGENQLSGYSCRCLKKEEEKEEVEDEEPLFECQLGANGQVVLWSSQRETIISRFDFMNPNKTASPKANGFIVDHDGDVEVLRKNHLNRKEEVLLIEHQNSTTLDLVGEQLWSGALFLADFILHNPDIFTGTHILEVAAGVGLTSVIASMFAKQVTVTDIDRGDILKLIRRNIDRNRQFVSGDIDVKEIDFTKESTVDALEEHLKNTSIILAADVIYHNDLTDAFLKTILHLMSKPPNKTLYLAMEKRYVFTMEDMDAMAPCYEYLLTRLDWLICQNLSSIEWSLKVLDAPSEQYFTYERNKHLVIFEIKSKLKT